MARSDLVLNLVRAGVLGDQKIIGGIVDALVSEERAKNHNLLADKIQSIYQATRKRASDAASRRVSNEERLNQSEFRFNAISPDVADLLHESHPSDGLDSLCLDDYVRTSCKELVEEQLQSDLLRNHAIEPRNRIVLSGPPGNGKTSLAKSLAFELGLPLYVPKYESIFGSFLGETSARLKRVFDFVRSRPCVVFFDEFDTLGKERGDIHETGEIKRVVSALLLQIDGLPSHNVIVAATNHSELIDRAAWRRFQIRLELLPPKADEILSLIKKFNNELDGELIGVSEYLLDRLNGMSYSDIEQFFLDVKRDRILGRKSGRLDEIVYSRLDYLTHCFKQI